MKKLLGLIACSAFLFSCGDTSKTEEKTEPTTATESAAAGSRDYEFADNKFVDIGKKLSADLESGNIDGYVANFADNAVFHWNNYDSLNGKAAITDYWKKRRADVIDSMSFSKQIWLPVKVNKPLT